MMAPYNPPLNTHYSEMDLSEYDPEMVYDFIGKKGHRMYWLTRFLELSYLWYDESRKKLEIWGPFYTHQNKQSEHVIRCELDHYASQVL